MGAAAAIILRKEKDIVSAYRGAGATSPDRARSPEQLDIGRRLAFERLVQRAVLRDTGDGRYYLDEPSWEALRGIRRRMMLVIALVVAGALLVLVSTGVVTFGARR
jgi:hypothetical protein